MDKEEQKKNSEAKIHEFYEEYIKQLHMFAKDGEEIIPCFTERELNKLLANVNVERFLPDTSEIGFSSGEYTNIRYKRKTKNPNEVKEEPRYGEVKRVDATVGYDFTSEGITLFILGDDISVKVAKKLYDTEDGKKPDYKYVDSICRNNQIDTVTEVRIDLKDAQNSNGNRLANYTSRRYAKPVRNVDIPLDWTDLTEMWLTHDQENFGYGIDCGNKSIRTNTFVDKIDTNSFAETINYCLINNPNQHSLSMNFFTTNSKSFFYDYDHYGYKEIDDKYDKIEEEKHEKVTIESYEKDKADRFAGDNAQTAIDYLNTKRKASSSDMDDEKIIKLAASIRMLQENGFELTEEQQRILKLEENMNTSSMSEEKVSDIERRLEDYRNLKFHIEELKNTKTKENLEQRQEEKIAWEEEQREAQTRNEYFDEMRSINDQQKALQQQAAQKGFAYPSLDKEIENTDEFLEMKEYATNEEHIRDEGMSEMLRDWYQSEYGKEDTSSKQM